ncbi:flagellar M-ring protein FliF [Ramlibacter sp. G-1-2-2]|uniref:Flagellar M-ring protein n=1 Tax=Ramlibacter agri TaxID=2728837 RepID=A0A848H1F2_9BURK|nr:flagellar basal-body MS-ring/collar protein FliF [Ramlibacter agri]NML43411.1 flagellar M-ring protein FliF [Ramlibacter agri]
MDNRATPVPATNALPAGDSPLQRLLALPQRSKLALGVASLALAGLLAFALTAGREPDWRILYTSLSDKDGGTVIAALAQMNVPYKYSEGGAAILVPAEAVHDTRLRLASQGLPKGGTVGFELVENQKFGTTQFQERLNFQRGLEGELARSIMALSAVQNARVHLALPNQTAFLREQQKPSASVLLTLYTGRSLERQQVAGIVHLIASSVPELQTKAVSVIDQSGALLSEASDNATGLDAPQMQYVRQTEQDLSQRILAIVEPIVGAGNVKAQVTADIDFTQSESTAELYAPNQGSAPASVRSQHLTEAPGNGNTTGGSGSPGALSNQPPATPTSPVNGAPQAIGPVGNSAGSAAAVGIRRDAVTNYEVDKTVKVVRSATGNIRRLSAAVLVNHLRAAPGADGKPVVAKALSDAQMQQVNALVREAIGFNKDRGDSVEVVNAPFTGAAPDAKELPLWRQPEMQDLARGLARWLALPLVALIVVFGFVHPALRGLRRPPTLAAAPRLTATVEDAIAFPTPLQSAAAAAVPDPNTPLLPTAQAARQHERSTQLEAIRQLARTDPATVANVVRNWASQPS